VIHTKLIAAELPEAIPAALNVLERGGLVAFPTDTVYGVGALAFDPAAVSSIYSAKGRSPEKAIPVLIGRVEDLHLVAAGIPKMAEKLINRFWPGALTILVAKNQNVPDIVSPSATLAVRIPDHPVALALLARAGPMAVTSANRSDQPSPLTAQDVLAQLGGKIDLILDGGLAPGGLPSTLVDCSGASPIILRVGPINQDDLEAALH